MTPQDTDKTVDTEEVKHLDTNKRERIFPILRKLDAIWSHYPEKTFIEVTNSILKFYVRDITDAELLEILNDKIEKDGIKFN